MKKKSLITIIAIVLIIIIGLFVYRAVSSQPAAQKAQPTQTSKKVTATDALELKNGHKIIKAQVPVKKGETAMQQLKAYTSAHHIELSVTGSGKMAYVTSLEGLKAGGKKGWMFSVDGKTPKVGAGATIVKAHQKIIWYYTKF
ncbi:MAG: DUF4430 domain-containing protein [Sporolactobacillus sp.]